MDTNKKTAILSGVLFINATVAYSMGVILLDPILTNANYLTLAYEDENKLIIGAFLVLIDSVAVAAIGVVLYPVLKRHSNTLALGYAGARIIEGVLFIANVIAILTLLTLSQSFVNAGSPDTSHYQTLGAMILSAADWAYLLGLGLAFALSALILNFLLFQSRLIPRWISVWGFIGAALVLTNFLLQYFGIAPVEIFYLPIAVQEMVFAVWLIVKGFNISDSDAKLT